ncbi:MAG: hypothetical protein IKD47_00180 [Clostridia bacterium]|nr:hypothetical protein [Clostridia bacterium]
MQTLLKTTQAYQLLKTEREDARLGHAYLLLFNDSKNLRFALKTFAKLFFSCENFCENSYEISRENSDNDDAKKARISKLIDTETFSDCLFFPLDGKKLTVEDAEKIQEESTLNPVEGDKKLFVIGDFAEANVQTQNKLLKLLEEPPKGVQFLLGATTVFPVLPTVLSRTKKLEIQPFDVDKLTECLFRLYGDKYTRETLTLCAATSGGSVGEAQRILDGGYYKTLMDNAFALAQANPARLPALARQVGETKYQKELLSLLRILFRDALLIKTQGKNAEKSLMLRSQRAVLTILAEKYTLSALFFAQEAISEAEKQVRFNAVFPQCIELCIANIQAKNK